MQRTFKSKTALWFRVLVFLLLAMMCFFVWERIMIPALFLLILNVLVVKMLLKTEYVVGDGRLVLACGYFPVRIIEIADVVSVCETRGLHSLYALPSDRLEVRYGRNSVSVSPADKAGFIRELQKYNPAILFIR